MRSFFDNKNVRKSVLLLKSFLSDNDKGNNSDSNSALLLFSLMDFCVKFTIQFSNLTIKIASHLVISLEVQDAKISV